MLEDAMKLRIAAESRVQRCAEERAGFPFSIKSQKSFDPLALSKLHQGRPRLVLEKITEATRTKIHLKR